MTVIAPDVLLADRYRLVEPVGSGGMGTVWRAEDQILGRPVAVKVLGREIAAAEESRRRFRAEARAAASINHPNVVAVFDYGEQLDVDGECLSFLVMELVEGHSLAAELAASTSGRLPAAVVSAIVEQTALGLAAAHAQGVVHRDIKPGNLLLGPDRLVKITDFGIARAVDAAPLTRTGTMLGTALYLSPEQAEGKDATPASDLYSLGVVAFTCLTGAPPFRRESVPATLLAHVQAPIPALPSETPVALGRLVTDLLAKDPADRPASAEQVAARCRAGVAPGDQGPGSWQDVPPAQTQVLASTDVLPTAPRRPAHRGRLFAGIAVAVALAIAGLMLALASPSKPVKVPNVVGEPVTSARTALTRAGLAVTTQTVDAPDHAAGDVLGETPKAGTSLGHGKAVQLTVSSGRVRVDPTQYVGLPFTTAATKLAELGLHTTETYVVSTVNPGQVVSVAPSGEVGVGSTLSLGVATAPTAPATPAPPPSPTGPARGSHGGGPGHSDGKGQNQQGH